MEEQPNKKRRKVFIEDVITKDLEKIEPCLVKFSNGAINKSENIKGMLYRNNSEKHTRFRKQRMLKISSPNLSYIGKNFGDISLCKSYERTFLGILDKKTNKMKMVEMSSFLVHPNLEDSDLEADKEIDTKEGILLNEQRAKLSNLFGSQKSRGILKKRMENKLNIEDMGETMNTALNKVNVNDIINDVTKDVLDSRNFEYLLPNCDRTALNVREVYPLNNIIADEELLYFNEMAVEYLEADHLPEMYSPLFHVTVANSKLWQYSEEELAKRVCIALYTEQLINLLKGRKDGNSKILDNCPKQLKNKVFAFFMEGKNRVRSKVLEDRLIAHIVILALITNQYEVDWKSLSSSLNIKKERMYNMINVVGATLNRQTGIIKLKLPLAKMDMPSLKNKKKR